MATNEGKADRLAVLVDADNASATVADELFAKVNTLGEAVIRRAYGDFSSDRPKRWKAASTPYGIVLRQQLPGKNSTDISLVIDAMDLLHAGAVDAFCIVSSDSDFTALALRLRESGKAVYCFGTEKTPEGLRRACRAFFDTSLFGHALASKRPVGDPFDKALHDALFHLASNSGLSTGWITLSSLGKELRRRGHDFKRLGAQVKAKAPSLGLEYDSEKLRVRRR